ncbi:MAG: FHA domain-containing protein [Deltaproteobacteria bacterium]|nr:FHA domain-containing protein [Deltaproteobacteria bacterium]
MVRQSPVVQVFIFREGRFWGTELFAQQQIIMGRSPDVDLQLDDDVVSRTHAAMSLEAGKMVLEDLSSANGTFVNGEPVERCYLTSRDEVSIGCYTFKFKVLGKKKSSVQADETKLIDREKALKSIKDGTALPLEVEEEPETMESVTVPGTPKGQDKQPSRSKQEAGSLSSKRLEQMKRKTSVYKGTPFEDEVPLPAKKPKSRPIKQLADHRQEILAALRQETGGGAFDRSKTGDQSLVEEEVVSSESMIEDDASLGVSEEELYSYSGESGRKALPKKRPSAVEEIHAFGEGHRDYKDEPEQPLSSFDESLDGLDNRDAAREAPTFDQDDVGNDLAGTFAGEEAGALESAPEEYSDYGDEDDEDEEMVPPDFVEPFSLLNNLIKENFKRPVVQTVPEPVVEIIGYTSDHSVVRFDQIRKGQKYKLGPRGFVLSHFKNQDTCRVNFTDAFSGKLLASGKALSLDQLKNESNISKKKKDGNIYSYNLMEGDYANLKHEGGGSFLRFVKPPKLPPARTSFKLDTLNIKIFGSTFIAHIIFLGILGLFSRSVTAGNDVDLDRFAKVAVKYVEMEKPEEEAEVPLDQLPQPDKKEEIKQDKTEEKKAPPKKRRRNRRSKSRRRGSGGGGGGGGGAGIMAALGNLSQKKAATNIVAAVSNLDAVRVPGARSRFKVSGLVTKLPTSSVVVSRGRGVGVKAGIDLLRGGKGRGGRAGIGPGALRGGKAGRRSVGGVVFKAPKRRIRVRGHLSKAAIAKVVKQHLREIQYCYEKALLMNSNLQGKVQMQWTISISGSVTIVKTKQNTLATPAVAMCISAKIKRWKFPKPRGGIVVVTYPFIFNTVGF